MTTAFPMTSELLRAHPTYLRAQKVLSTWHTERLKAGPMPLTAWRQDHLDSLDMVNGKRGPTKSEWYWSEERRLTVQRMLFEFVRSTHHEDPEERMAAWGALQEAVACWDLRFANDLDVA